MIKLLLIYFSSVIIITILLGIFTLRSKAKSSLPFITLAFLLIMLFVPLFYGFYRYVYLSPVPEVMTPNVVGRKVGHALAELQELGLKGKVSPYESPEQVVQEQRPEGGMLVKSGRTIFLILAEYNPVVITSSTIETTSATLESFELEEAPNEPISE